MADYSRAMIYELFVDGLEMVYVGSTTQTLKQRLAEHKYYFKTNGAGASKILFTLGEVQIRLIEAFSCSSKTELEIREGFYIKQRNCVNMCVAGRTRDKWYLENRDKILEKAKEYKLENKDKILEQRKEYRLENIDKISEKNKEYQLENKDKISEYGKEYRLKHRDKILEKTKVPMTCNCGSTFRKNEKSRHERSAKHQTYLLTL